MRLVSTDPEFTWSGTLFILGATTIAGICTGLAYRRWRNAAGNVWRLFGLAFLPLGMAAGGVMIPSVVTGGLAWGRSTWPKWSRLLLTLGAVGFQIFFFLGVDDVNLGPGGYKAALYALFLGIEIWAFSIITRPLHRSVDVLPSLAVAKTK